ncbi:MAG TPA: NAD(P)-binding domain-containing protein, partial [Dehalococcoidia bacterium]|nr:NAD(P)-binding domain-containing protein [Dehalococcoidia bacterium]
MTVERVGFVGLGIMGAPMAANLVTAGFEVTVWNRSPGRSAELEKLDASVGDSPADVAAASEIVV